ncbi:MAG: hypothetical protein RR770_08410, partial [Bacteroidales bacterium]
DSLGEGFALTFNKDVKLLLNTPSDSSSNTVGYIAKCAVPKNELVITFFTATNKMDEILLGANEKLLKSKVYRQENLARWNGYFKSVIREDMPMEYNGKVPEVTCITMGLYQAMPLDILWDSGAGIRGNMLLR